MLQTMPDDLGQGDLHAGSSPWGSGGQGPRGRPLAESTKTDVLVVGGGITGSIVAQHLAVQGLDVVIADREPPGYGSTAASTAMLLWEIDRSLAELTAIYGFETAATVYRHSTAAMQGLGGLIASLGIDCRFSGRPTLYIAGSDAPGGALVEEHRLRQRAGLPGVHLGYADLFSRFGIDRAEAIYSPGAAEADPLLMSWGLLADATARGARLVEADIKAYDHGPSTVVALTESDQLIEARHVVLATGYIMPDFVNSDLHQTVSSYAIATPPQKDGALWPERALIWEASSNYLYTRTTADGRIVIGGGDDETTDADERAEKLAGKAVFLEDSLRRLWPRAEGRADYSWSGAFGTTCDGLPLIGPVPSMPRIFAAYGYGGNGITFSFMASRMLAAHIAGRQQAWFETFALDRAPLGL